MVIHISTVNISKMVTDRTNILLPSNMKSHMGSQSVAYVIKGDMSDPFLFEKK